jgi:hypothetical protein
LTSDESALATSYFVHVVLDRRVGFLQLRTGKALIGLPTSHLFHLEHLWPGQERPHRALTEIFAFKSPRRYAISAFFPVKPSKNTPSTWYASGSFVHGWHTRTSSTPSGWIYILFKASSMCSTRIPLNSRGGCEGDGVCGGEVIGRCDLLLSNTRGRAFGLLETVGSVCHGFVCAVGMLGIDCGCVCEA